MQHHPCPALGLPLILPSEHAGDVSSPGAKELAMQQVAMLRAGSVQGQDPLLAHRASHDQAYASAASTHQDLA